MFLRRSGIIINEWRNGFNGVFSCAVIILAFTAEKQMPTPGALPSFATTMARRSEIGDALQATYIESKPPTAGEYLRVFVRACLMPVFRMLDTENKSLVLTV